MNKNTTTSWYFIYTKQGSERKIADFLRKKNIDYYCPAAIRTKQKRGEDVLSGVLFPSYMFVSVQQSQQEMVKKIPGVINFVYWQQQPVIVPSQEIEEMKQFIQKHPSVYLEKIPVSINNTVTFSHGSFIHHEGRIARVTGNATKIALPTIGYALIAKLNKVGEEALEKIATSPQLPGLSMQRAS